MSCFGIQVNSIELSSALRLYGYHGASPECQNGTTCSKEATKAEEYGILATSCSGITDKREHRTCHLPSSVLTW